MTNYVYLKLQKHSGSSALIDTIPLKVSTVSVSVDKSIPNFPLPFSGLATGESLTAALDLGMSNKRISLSGVLLETTIQRSHTKTGGTPDSLLFTAQELAQMIASGVDSTGLAKYQAINELIVLTPSFVNENYADRGKAADASVSENGTVSALIPLTFSARGETLQKDNTFVATPFAFPTSETSSGLKGFIQSFGYELSAEAVEVTFNMEFVVAGVIP